MFEDQPLAANAASFAASAAVVWAAGTRLASYADAIADKTGIGRAMLGLLLLGGVTSLPEMAVAVSATLAGSPGLSVNNVLGAASINVVILAVADAVYGRRALTSTPASPDVLLQGTLCIVLLAIAAAATVAGDVLVLGLGAWSWVILAAYLGAVRMIAAAQGQGAWAPRLAPTTATRDAHRQGDGPLAALSLRRLLAGTLVAGAAICAAGFVLARSADAIAEQTGLGAGFVGAVLLAASTTLPELSTVLAAVRLTRYEMAIADIFGTNLFNVTIVVLVDALHGGGPVLPEAGRFAGFGALLAIVLIALIVLGMIERRDRTVLRMGVDSIAVVVCYLAGVAVLFQLR